MPGSDLPVVRPTAELISTYARAAENVRAMGAAALARGAGGTAGYYDRQLLAILAMIDSVKAQTPGLAAGAAGTTYATTAVAIDRVVHRGARELAVGGRFASIHGGAIDALAGNMATALERAATQLGQSVKTTFELADLIDGALGPSSPTSFLGRRVNDRARSAALQTVGEHLAAASTRRDASKVLRLRISRLAHSGTQDALRMVRNELTGEMQAAFVDRAGRRWSLDTYTKMVARTTTREATTAATKNRLLEHNLPLVTVSDHQTETELCQFYEGKTFSLDPDAVTDEYPLLDAYPPFHPNCRHYLTPAGVAFADLERQLGLARAATFA